MSCFRNKLFDCNILFLFKFFFCIWRHIVFSVLTANHSKTPYVFITYITYIYHWAMHIIIVYSLIMYIMMPTSMGPGIDPLSFLVISSSIDLVHSVSIHSSARNSALWDASASNATSYRTHTIIIISDDSKLWPGRIISAIRGISSAILSTRGSNHCRRSAC